jgi:hypothetical protein
MVCVCLVAVVASGGCSGDPQSSADCAAQVRADGVVYTSNGTTEHRASRYASAERADCHDVGNDAAGSVFPDEPDRVATWTFEGYAPTKVLGVRYSKDAFGVFVADSVSAEESQRIYADLARE